MKKKIAWLILSCLMVAALVLASCTTEVEEEEEEEVTPPMEEEEEEVTPPVGENWWDKLGEPEYGGMIIHQTSDTTVSFDSSLGYSPFLAWIPWLDNLFCYDWTLDRETWPYTAMYSPIKYYVGNLVESWEQPDPGTMIVHIREGVNFQNKPPVNGRELTAYDVEYHYHWLLGTGSGYTEPNPLYTAWMGSIGQVTATDEYTINITFKKVGISGVLQILDAGTFNYIEAPESIEAEGGKSITDWRKAVGTGPWMLIDFVSGSSMTFDRNPNYWRYDERYPENQLPYADKLKALVIPDFATSMAALRTGKIDILSSLTWEQAASLERTNPELLMGSLPPTAAPGYHMRVDREPFTDIRVRIALQMAVDCKTISETHYGGNADPTPAGMIDPILKGYNFPYEEWPQTLKDEYSYNPERAKELLAEAGYPNGFETHILAAATDDLDLAQIVRAYFLDIGVDMEIRTMEGASHFQIAYAGEHEQMFLHMGTKGFPPTISSTAYYSTHVGNFARVNDPTYDALYEKYSNAITEDEAMEAIRDADRWVIEHHPTIFFPTCPVYNAWQPYLKGYSGELISWSGWQYYTRLWIDQDLKESMGR